MRIRATNPPPSWRPARPDPFLPRQAGRLASPLLGALLGLLPALPARALFNVFTDKPSFLDASGATNATGPIPLLQPTTTNPILGTVRISPAAGPAALRNVTSPRLDGPLLGFQGLESFTATFNQPVHAAGFDMVEPRLDPRLEGTFLDSVFLVRLLLDATEVGRFEYAPPDDAAGFCGVTSDRPFDRLVLTEIRGGAEDEAFGSFHCSSRPQSPTRPADGIPVPAFAGLESTLQDYLESSRYPGLQVAVLRNGRLVFDRAYGWSDASRTLPLARRSPMTLASVSKIFTDAAITRLIREGRLQGTNTLVELLGLVPPPGHTFSTNATSITIDHLLGHAAGLAEYRPDNARVGTDLGLGRPASFAECLAWSLCQPLLFTPGTATSYSNLGYVALGVVVEKVSGLAYGDYLRDAFARPLLLDSLSVPVEAPVQPAAPLTDLLAENYENNAAAGGVQCSAEDLARFMRAYRGNGVPKPRPVPSGGFFFTFYGSADGALTVFNQRISGGIATEFAVLCNDRGYLNNDHLRNLVFAALDAIPDWPAHNLFPRFTWHMDHFWNVGVADVPSLSLPLQDYDGDGLSNFLEYVLDQDPARPSSPAESLSASHALAGAFRFPAARDPLKPDVRYELQLSTDLQRWQPVARSTSGQPFAALVPGIAPTESFTPGAPRVDLHLEAPSTTDQTGFFRIHVEPD